MSQSSMILAHMKRGHPLTPIVALRLFGCFRLSGRIYDLKRTGHDICSHLMTVAGGKRVSLYYLRRKK